MVKSFNIFTTKIVKLRGKNRAKLIFEEIIAELYKTDENINTYLRVTPEKINKRKSTHKHYSVKLLKTRFKEKNLKK